METENRYLSGSDLNIERLIKQKKWAKVVIAFACIGIFAGCSAAVTFFFQYKLVVTPILALVSAIIAGFVVYIHVQFLRDVWQIWTYQLKYWCILGFVLQISFASAFIVLIGLGIYYKDSLSAGSYYIMSVWSFMSWKWSFTLFYRTKRYRSMFTRYSLIGIDGDINSDS